MCWCLWKAAFQPAPCSEWIRIVMRFWMSGWSVCAWKRFCWGFLAWTQSVWMYCATEMNYQKLTRGTRLWIYMQASGLSFNLSPFPICRHTYTHTHLLHTTPIAKGRGTKFSSFGNHQGRLTWSISPCMVVHFCSASNLMHTLFSEALHLLMESTARFIAQV